MTVCTKLQENKILSNVRGHLQTVGRTQSVKAGKVFLVVFGMAEVPVVGEENHEGINNN